MKFKYLATLAPASIISLELTGVLNSFNTVNAYPCAGANLIKNPAEQ